MGGSTIHGQDCDRWHNPTRVCFPLVDLGQDTSHSDRGNVSIYVDNHVRDSEPSSIVTGAFLKPL